MVIPSAFPISYICSPCTILAGVKHWSALGSQLYKSTSSDWPFNDGLRTINTLRCICVHEEGHCWVIVFLVPHHDWYI